MDSYEQIFRYKLILFGNIGVGKTSLVERFVNDKFEESYISTLGYNVYEKRILHDNFIISLMIYDIGGQEQFQDLRKHYSQGANAAFIVYDVTDLESFSQLMKWKNDLVEFTGEIPFIVLGNKIDLINERKVRKEDALLMCSLLGAVASFETSAKNGKGVEDAFYQIALRTYLSYSPGIMSI